MIARIRIEIRDSRNTAAPLAGKLVVIPGRREAVSPEPVTTTLIQFVMLALVASIHALDTALREGRRGSSRQA
jgi:hypothetical protein